MKTALGLLAAAVAALGAFLVWGGESAVAVNAVTPRREDIVSRLSTNGRVEPVDDFTVHAKTTGTIAKVFAKQGDKVKQGQLLFSIDDQAARAALRQAEARLEMAQAELAAAERGGAPAEIAEQESLLGQARAERKQAAEEVAALERLVQKNAAPRAELEAARARLAAAEAEIERLESKLKLRVAPDQLQRAQARLREAESAVAVAKQQVGSASVRSPSSGVVYNIDFEPGTYVNPGMLLARVGRIEQVKVRIFVDEPELGRIERGDRAVITADAFPDREWECAIDRLATAIITLETRRVGELLCTIQNMARTLIPNLRVNVEIETAAAEAALTLPREAVYRDNGGSYVWLIGANNTAERRAIELGISSATRVEVKTGVDADTRVLLPGEAALSEGQEVAVTAASSRP